MYCCNDQKKFKMCVVRVHKYSSKGDFARYYLYKGYVERVYKYSSGRDISLHYFCLPGPYFKRNIFPRIIPRLQNIGLQSRLGRI